MNELNARPPGVSRRTVLAVAGAAALGWTGIQGDEPMEAGELERANEALVNDFCRDWAKRDAEALRPYLWEDLVYQITPGQPLITSVDQFIAQMGPFMKKMESIRWDILRSHAIGPLVLNERVDYFNAPEGGRSMEFRVAGHFVIEEGRIRVWKDWPIPGARQVIG